MFERDKEGRAGPVDVEIGLGDGRILSGKLIVPPGRTLPELLNGTATFVEFEPLEGGRVYLAKTALQSVTPANIPPAPDLWAGPTEGAGFDPYKVLGIDADATHERAREAYLALAKAYHPDKYASTELPREVRAYLSVMVRRINAAHDAVEARIRKKAAKQEPVFTK
jgi:DnaJ domain